MFGNSLIYEEQKDLGEGYYITFRTVSNGLGGRHPVNITINRYDDEWYYYEINDKFGMFNDFPGVQHGEWIDKLETEFYSAIRYVFYMTEFVDGKSTVKWMVQPDGIYFQDEDGFGMENFSEIWLYSIMDTQGHFLIPFTEKEIEHQGKWIFVL